MIKRTSILVFLEMEASVGGTTVEVPIDMDLASFGSSRLEISCAGDRLTNRPEVEGVGETVWVRA